jgi:hypothetical protein
MAAILFQDGRHIGEIIVWAVLQKAFVEFWWNLVGILLISGRCAFHMSHMRWPFCFKMAVISVKFLFGP